jgi:hypothetical protein
MRGGVAEGRVSIYDADDDLLSKGGLTVRVFQSADREWLEFVFASRKDAGFRHGCDIVAGPVANDRVFACLNLFEQGFLDVDATLARLKTYVLVDQVSFHTAAALAEIRFAGSEVVN